MPLLRTASALFPVLMVITVPAFAASSLLEGRWLINQELTSEVRPDDTDYDWFDGFVFNHSISVGGVPVPTGSSPTPTSNTEVKNPEVLQTHEMIIALIEDEALLTYVGVGKEQLRKGSYRGTRSKWSNKKLTSSYQSTSRKVTKTYEIRKDGRLLVTVKLNPKEGKTRVYKRVFDRVDS